jgi:hypothetical protein
MGVKGMVYVEVAAALKGGPKVARELSEAEIAFVKMPIDILELTLNPDQDRSMPEYKPEDIKNSDILLGGIRDGSLRVYEMVSGINKHRLGSYDRIPSNLLDNEYIQLILRPKCIEYKGSMGD